MVGLPDGEVTAMMITLAHGEGSAAADVPEVSLNVMTESSETGSVRARRAQPRTGTAPAFLGQNWRIPAAREGDSGLHGLREARVSTGGRAVTRSFGSIQPGDVGRARFVRTTGTVQRRMEIQLRLKSARTGRDRAQERRRELPRGAVLIE